MKRILTLIALLYGGTVAAQTITTDSVFQTSTCAGGNVIVTYSTTGSFGTSSFKAQLSDMWGGWGSPIDIGSIPLNLGIIFAKIPASTTFGIFYKIRVVSTSPAVIGSESPNNVIITSIAQLTNITTSPGDTACEGDTITLSTLLPGNAYEWSTTESTQEIKVTTSGSYSVTVTDILTCKTSDTVEVYFENCNPSSIGSVASDNITIGPNPTHGPLNIQGSFNELWIVDMLGRTRLITDRSEVDISHLAKGIYMVLVHTDSGVLRRTIALSR